MKWSKRYKSEQFLRMAMSDFEEKGWIPHHDDHKGWNDADDKGWNPVFDDKSWGYPGAERDIHWTPDFCPDCFGHGHGCSTCLGTGRDLSKAERSPVQIDSITPIHHDDDKSWDQRDADDKGWDPRHDGRDWTPHHDDDKGWVHHDDDDKGWPRTLSEMSDEWGYGGHTWGNGGKF